jgi:hypothetical protein
MVTSTSNSRDIYFILPNIPENWNLQTANNKTFVAQSSSSDMHNILNCIDVNKQWK